MTLLRKEEVIYRKIEGAKGPNYIGFELEVVTENPPALIKLLSSISEIQFVEELGIPIKSGFEIVSDYGDFEQVYKVAEKVFKITSEHCIEYDEVGLHVHLTKRDVNSTARLIDFWNKAENQEFIFKFAQRESLNAVADPDLTLDNYSPEDLIKATKCYNIVAMKENTVEIRAFKAGKSVERMLDCLTLSYFSYASAGQKKLSGFSSVALAPLPKLWYNQESPTDRRRRPRPFNSLKEKKENDSTNY